MRRFGRSPRDPLGSTQNTGKWELTPQHDSDMIAHDLYIVTALRIQASLDPRANPHTNMRVHGARRSLIASGFSFCFVLFPSRGTQRSTRLLTVPNTCTKPSALLRHSASGTISRCLLAVGRVPPGTRTGRACVPASLLGESRCVEQVHVCEE